MIVYNVVNDNGVNDMYVNILYPYSERKLFTDRENILRRLWLSLDDVREGEFKGFTLFGIRRSGKTLILKEFLLNVLGEPDVNVIYVDFEGFPKDPNEMLDRLLGTIIFWLQTRGDEDYIRFLDPRSLISFPKGSLDESFRRAIMEYLSTDKLDLKFRIILKLLIESQRPVVFIMDEFQDFLTTMLNEKVDPLGIMREVLRSKVLLVLSGSVRSIMRKISRDFRERYFLQMKELELDPFDLRSTWELVEKILGIKISGRLAAEFLRMTGGFPFYIYALADKTKELMKTFNSRPEDVLETAFIQEVFSTSGLVYEHCRYLWTEYVSYAKRKRYLRTILEEISLGPKKISALTKILNVDYNIVYKYVDELINLGLAIKENNNIYIFNRVFALWILARRELPEITRITPSEKTLIRKLKELEKRVALAEKIASHSFELMAQTLIAMKMGKKITPKELGVSNIETMEIPNKARFNLIKKKNGKIYELDILLENNEKIAVEITISKIDAKYIKETMDIWKTNKYWFISYRGFTKSAIELAQEHPKIILTTANDIERAIKKELTNHQHINA